MDEFDLLSYLSSAPVVNVQSELEIVPSDFQVPKSESVVEDDDLDVPVHYLDLPLLTLKPPSQVLYVLLRLLKKDAPVNFGNHSETKSMEQILEDRGLSMLDIEDVMPWYREHTIFHSVPRLIYISRSATEINQYLLSIVSSPLSWIESDECKEQIWTEAGLRIAEQCDRTVQPEFTRKIILQNASLIELIEPLLTYDNLGLKTWGSSFILSQRLINNPDLLKEPVLELGSGTGLVGITCSRLGVKDLTLTDLPDIVVNLTQNVSLNNLAPVPKIEVLDWSNTLSFDSLNNGRKYNTLIFSDALYSPQHLPWIVELSEKYLATGGQVLLQIPIRKNFHDVRELLWVMMLKHFTEIESIYENGYDDFGEQEFLFKIFIHSSSNI